MKRIVLVSLFAILFALVVLAPQTTHAAPPALPPHFTRVPMGSGMSEPTSLAFLPDGRILVTEKGGDIRIVRWNGSLKVKPFYSFSVNTDSERGLLGIALDPHYQDNGFIYVYYTTGPDAKNYSGNPKNRVSRINKRLNKPGFKEKILLDNIPSDAGNHNGGDIHFGFDGKLYIAVGDSGCGPCHDQAQTLDSLRGKILRINSNGTIPTDNPFYNTPGARQEIYAFGFRNPWRFTTRASNQSYIVADVGQNTWEEINSLQKGKNFGWNVYEGPCPSNNLSCDPNSVNYNGTIKPIHWYNHNSGGERGNVIAGGVVVEHSNYPAPYAGAYFYGDLGGGWVHYLTLDANNQVQSQGEFDTGVAPDSFGSGLDGNLYVVSYGNGELYKYVYTP